MGKLLIVYDDEAVTGLYFDKAQTQDFAQNAVIEKCVLQLNEYFAGGRTIFDVPLRLAGTEFQQAVWAQLEKIPFGETATYGQVAAAIGNAQASRAVGGANNKNPVSIIVPCHRVIGAGGKLVGYGGEMWRKEWLLKHENEFQMKGAI